jgi:hypothetical protein
VHALIVVKQEGCEGFGESDLASPDRFVGSGFLITIIIEKNRMQLFNAVQNFLEEKLNGGRS